MLKHANLADDKSTIRMLLLGKDKYALPYIPNREFKVSSLA
jgi:hypothetical protein